MRDDSGFEVLVLKPERRRRGDRRRKAALERLFDDSKGRYLTFILDLPDLVKGCQPF